MPTDDFVHVLLNKVTANTLSAERASNGARVFFTVRAADFGGGTVDILWRDGADPNASGVPITGLSFTVEGQASALIPKGVFYSADLNNSTNPVDFSVTARQDITMKR